MLVNTKEMFAQAQAKKTAVGAFNIENLEMAQAVICAAEEREIPVILQTTSSTLKYATPAAFAGIVRALAEKSSVPVALHLDHGNSLALVEEALEAGYTSVMYDGSLKEYAENVENSRLAAKAAHRYGACAEAELGSVGGKEDDHQGEVAYTDPDQAQDFVKRTGIDSLAVAIGTAHGIYRGKPKLDFDRLQQLAALLPVPLVLHGASGLSDDMIRQAVRLGICKVNIATDLRIAFSDGVKAYLKENPDVFDPKKYLGAGRSEVAVCAGKKMEVISGR